MSAALLLLLVAVNPIAVAAEVRRPVDRRVLAAGLAATALLAVALAAAGEAVLDLLSVSAPTFRVAAGVVLLLAAARWVLLGPRRLPPEDELLAEGADTADPSPWSGLLVPLLVPVLVSPHLVMISTSVGADEGVLPVAVGAAVALALTGAATLLPRGRPALWSTAVRFTALPAAALAAGLIVDGVKAI